MDGWIFLLIGWLSHSFHWLIALIDSFLHCFDWLIDNLIDWLINFFIRFDWFTDYDWLTDLLICQKSKKTDNGVLIHHESIHGAPHTVVIALELEELLGAGRGEVVSYCAGLVWVGLCWVGWGSPTAEITPSRGRKIIENKKTGCFH